MWEGRMEKIKVGIFGLSRGMAYAESFLLCNAEIVAICDSKEDRLKAASEKLNGTATLYTDFDAFLSHEMDAVLLANYFDQHTPYAIRCLEKGIHVLSECTAGTTMAECVALARAVERSSATYMLAENYPYMCFNREMRRVMQSGILGKPLYAEGEYNHGFDPEDEGFWRGVRPTSTHWRQYLPRTYYITHSLGPVIYATEAMPKKVTAWSIFNPIPEEKPSGSSVGDCASVITTLNDDGSVFKVTGCAGYGGHGNSYRIVGEKGQVENLRGMEGKMMLQFNPWNVPEGKQTCNLYEPEWQDEDEEKIKKAGHDGSDFLVVREFLTCLREGKTPFFDVYKATAMSAVGILAHRSVLNGGSPYDIPDFRNEEDRKWYEDDHFSPFLSAMEGYRIPCSSHPEYQPTEKQMKRYKQIVGEKE
ncbi:MAG: Gfo/Idh/MocA family oxidoreductase [Clostridiales bacterium]|nr:Gfo/Idh/MocA family oxidoreductase [Clostridiales bacterium]